MKRNARISLRKKAYKKIKEEGELQENVGGGVK